MRLDYRDKFPSGMEEYLSYYGWHFNKRMCDWAVSKMKNASGPIQPYTKEVVDAMLKKHGIVLNTESDYDAVYVANMAKADYFGSSIVDEQHLAKFIKDFINDTDGYDEVAFTRFYADCIAKGCIIPWEDVI